MGTQSRGQEIFKRSGRVRHHLPKLLSNDSWNGNNYEDPLRFFKDNAKLMNVEERPVEYSFINGSIVLVETLQSDMAEIKNKLENLRRITRL